MISSVGNPAVRRVRRLRKRAWRERRSQVLIEGHRSVGAALDAGIRLEQLFYTSSAARLRGELLARARAGTARINEVSDPVMEHLTAVATAPDILAVAPMRETRLDAVAGGTVLVLRRVHDPATAGAILACAAATGIDAAVVTRGSVDVFAPKCLRSAQGAHFRLRLVRDVDPDDALGMLGATASRMFALADEGVPPWDAALDARSVVLVEDEPSPLPEAVVPIALPASGAAPSLTARAAVVLYEWLRQRGA